MKALFVAFEIHLLDQASKKLNTWQVNHGIIQGGRNTNPSANVQVMSIQTIMSQGIPFQPDLIVVDEAHNTGSDSYQTLFNTCPNAKRLLISATPKREDGRGFDHIASKMIEVVTAQELILNFSVA